MPVGQCQRILITGGAGFIGSNLTGELLREDYAVIAVDNLDPYYDVEVKKRNIRKYIDVDTYKFVVCDIRDSAKLAGLLQENGVEAVIHLAARPGVRASFENPSIYDDINVKGTLSVLEACVRSHVRKVLYASSSSVYGNPEYLPIDEKHPTNPISPYGRSKHAAERSCLHFERLYGLQCVILRYFTVYGPRQRPDEAIFKFTRLARDGKPVVVYGDGTQTRDFTYVSDTVAGTRLALEKDISGVFNLGSGERISVNDLITLLESAIGKKLTRVRAERHRGDVNHTQANIEKARQEFGYQPEVKIPEGIKFFYEWFCDCAVGNQA